MRSFTVSALRDISVSEFSRLSAAELCDELVDDLPFDVCEPKIATAVPVGLCSPMSYEGGVTGAALAFAVFNIARLLVYWGVLGIRRSTRSIWWPAVFLTIATTGAGLILARLPTLIAPHGFEAILIAAMSVLTLTGIAALSMPISRRSLLAFRNDGGKI